MIVTMDMDPKKFIFIINLFCLMPQCTLFCGKDIIREEVSVERILNAKGAQGRIYEKPLSLNLSGLSLTTLKGIEELDFEDITELNLSNNALEDIQELASAPNVTLVTLSLSNNKLTQLDEMTLFNLSHNFPYLVYIDLSGNPLENKSIIKQWERENECPFLINFQYNNQISQSSSEESDEDD